MAQGNKHSFLPSILIAILLLSSTIVFAQTDLTGFWVFRVPTGDGNFRETFFDLKQNGEQVTYEHVIAPKALPPGKYKLEIQATDQLTKQTVSRSADFTVTPPAVLAKAATDTTTGR